MFCQGIILQQLINQEVIYPFGQVLAIKRIK
jgi:hypothetical protein